MFDVSPGFRDSGSELSKSETGKSWMRIIFFVSRFGQKWWLNFLGQLMSCRIKRKEIFKRSYVDGQEDKKIAEELDISLNTIKTQKQRAKSYLRGRLGDLFVYAGMFFPGL